MVLGVLGLSGVIAFRGWSETQGDTISYAEALFGSRVAIARRPQFRCGQAAQHELRRFLG